MTETPASLRVKRPALELRGRVFAAVRHFFASEGYLEVETPVRVKTPAMESHIDAEPAGDHWLRTSPELHMKRLVCAGYERIVQIGPCFRQGERGTCHHPEYTMLEWYRTGAGVGDLIAETHQLLQTVCRALGVSQVGGVQLDAAPEVISVRDLFWLHAGWDPVESFETDRFDLDLVDKVEPVLAEYDVPVIVTDFPAERAALARLHPDNPRVAQRWELYIAGMELANAYTELTDAREQRQRFESCALERAGRGQTVYPLDEAFLSALDEGMPDCAGIALGLDRLVMLLANQSRIQDVLAFGE